MQWLGLGMLIILGIALVCMFLARVLLLFSGVPLKAHPVWLIDDARLPPNSTEARIWSSSGLLGVACFEGIRVAIAWISPNDLVEVKCQNLANQKRWGLARGVTSSFVAGGGLTGGALGAVLGGAIGTALGPKTPHQLDVWLGVRGRDRPFHLREKEAGLTVMLPIFNSLGIELSENPDRA